MLESVAIWLVSVAIRVLGRTLRYRVEGLENLEGRLRAGLPTVLYGWHEQIPLACIPLSRYRPTVMISQSRDGEHLARISERFGWRSVRGSSGQGGVRALLALVRAVRRGALGVHAVDGSRGPPRRIKPGLLLLGRRSGASLVPVLLAARWCWRTPSWDRMQIPFPFSPVRIWFGEPVEVPEELSKADEEALLGRLEDQLLTQFARLERGPT